MADDFSERMTRLEERLIAERSVRKTRDDQLFKFISQVRDDFEKQGRSLDEISEQTSKISASLDRISSQQKDQEGTLKKIVADDEVQKADINQIKGSIHAIKFIWPLIITLLGLAFTLFASNIDLRLGDFDLREPTRMEKEVKDRPKLQK